MIRSSAPKNCVPTYEQIRTVNNRIRLHNLRICTYVCIFIYTYIFVYIINNRTENTDTLRAGRVGAAHGGAARERGAG